MKEKIVIGLIISIFITTIVIAQGWTLPSTFTINPNFTGLPTPQANQKIFGCSYTFPIQLRDIKVYNYNLQGLNLNLNASFSLYTKNKTSVCNVKQKVFNINLVTWQNNLASYIVNQSNNSITTQASSGNPISTGGQG